MSKIVVHGFNTWPNIEYKYNYMIRQHIEEITFAKPPLALPPIEATPPDLPVLPPPVLILQHYRLGTSARSLQHGPPSWPAQHGADPTALMYLGPGPCSSTRSSLPARSHGADPTT